MAATTKRHKCNECGKLFRSPSDLAAHDRVHSGEKPFPCEECGKWFSNKSSLREHLRIHTGEKPYKCEQCGDGFTLKSSLTRHQRRHSGEKPFECEVCAKRFAQIGQLRIHQRVHTGDKPYKCEQCDKRFSQKGSFLQHGRTHTGEKPYVCAECGDSFTVKSTLTAHQRKHSGEKPFVCEACGKPFAQIGQLRNHQRVHTGDKPYKCEHCGKRFSQICHLQYHVRIHTGDKPYVCEECGQGFPLKSALTTHSHKHSGEKPFQCDVCGKRFTRNLTLQSHRRIHAEGYKCSKCGKSFILQRHLREHMLHHTDPDQFKCATCGRRFAWKQQLRLHQVSCGSSFKCDVPGCDFDTKKYIEIEDHRVKAHGKEWRLKCPICNECFASHHVLKGHERRVHNGHYAHMCEKCGVGLDNVNFRAAHKKNCKGGAAAFRGRVRQVAERHRIEKDYELTEEVVGQGLSSVFKAKGLKPADIGKEFAVKKINVKRDTPAENRAATYRALTEAQIAKARCMHENTAGVEAVFYQDDAVYTVAKLVRPGNLLKAVTKLFLKGKLFEEADVASIIKDILSGLGHLHAQGILHRDMKTANVLLGADAVCMIVDFGESAVGGPQRGTGVGTDGYRPPEAWGDEKQTTALDVYPLGVIAAECMAMRGAPERYTNRSPPSPEFEDFLEHCLQHDAAARPTVAALLEHPFIKLADRSSLKDVIATIV